MDVALPPTPVGRVELLEYLIQSGYETNTVDHPPLFTVEDSQKLRGEIVGSHTKNLFLKDKKGQYFLLTAQEDSVVNLKTLHKLLGGSSRFSFGSADKMVEFLGVSPGAVTALGVINDRGGNVEFAIDKRLLEHTLINCHPLTNEATTTLSLEALISFSKKCNHEPQIVDLAQEV